MQPLPLRLLSKKLKESGCTELWYVRCQDNTDGPTWHHEPQEDTYAPDLFKESRPPAADVEGQNTIWETMWRWMLGPAAPAAPAAPAVDGRVIAELTARVTAGSADGSLADAAVEPLRVSAAYQLAELGDAGAAALLEVLLGSPDELSEHDLHGWGPRRSAAYALSFSTAASVVPALAEAAVKSPLRELRALCIFSLSQSASLDPRCLEPALEGALDESGFVRSTAVAALGFAGRRLAAAGGTAQLAAAGRAVLALADAVGGPDIANDFYGAGEGLLVEDFANGMVDAGRGWAGNSPIRSAVRENAVISLCMIATVAVPGGASLGGGEPWEQAAAVLGPLLHTEGNKFVHAFLHETVRRMCAASAAGGRWSELWEAFERSDRWRPPHYQVACNFVSPPSAPLFEGGGR